MTIYIVLWIIGIIAMYVYLERPLHIMLLLHKSIGRKIVVILAADDTVTYGYESISPFNTRMFVPISTYFGSKIILGENGTFKNSAYFIKWKYLDSN
jgi:hypothetical protein